MTKTISPFTRLFNVDQTHVKPFGCLFHLFTYFIFNKFFQYFFLSDLLLWRNWINCVYIYCMCVMYVGENTRLNHHAWMWRHIVCIRTQREFSLICRCVWVCSCLRVSEPIWKWNCLRLMLYVCVCLTEWVWMLFLLSTAKKIHSFRSVMAKTIHIFVLFVHCSHSKWLNRVSYVRMFYLNRNVRNPNPMHTIRE